MTRRRKRILLVTAAIVVGLVAIQATQFIRPSREITIAVLGTPGHSIEASFSVDGERHDETRQLPTKFSFQARDVSFSIIPAANPAAPAAALHILILHSSFLLFRPASPHQWQG